MEATYAHMGVEIQRSIYLISYTRPDLLSTKGDPGSRRLAMPYLS